jgi:histidinol-phosphatase
MGAVTTAAYGTDWSASMRRAEPADLEAWLAFAHDCCDVADAISLAAFRTDLDVREKSDGSFVTDADRAIEREIRGRLAARFPDHGIVGEEYGAAQSSTETRWLLDPIDGTHNFMRGVPIFGTLLAVERDGEIQVGVISAPAIGQRWFASRGQGAWASASRGQSPRRLGVSTIEDVGRSQLLYRAVTATSGAIPSSRRAPRRPWSSGTWARGTSRRRGSSSRKRAVGSPTSMASGR